MILVGDPTLDFYSNYHSAYILLEHLQLWPQASQTIIVRDTMQPCPSN